MDFASIVGPRDFLKSYDTKDSSSTITLGQLELVDSSTEFDSESFTARDTPKPIGLGKFEKGVTQYEMTEANEIIDNLPQITNYAASRGRDSVAVMELRSAFHSGDSNPPELNEAQKKVFEALKAQGMSPTIEQEYFMKPGQNGVYEKFQTDPRYSWVLKANWSDTNRPDLMQQTIEGRELKDRRLEKLRVKIDEGENDDYKNQKK